MLLETNRLIIEYFNTSDISDWAEIESDADVRRFVDGKVLSLKEAGEYVELNIRQYQTHGYGRYAIRLKESRKLMELILVIDTQKIPGVKAWVLKQERKYLNMAFQN